MVLFRKVQESAFDTAQLCRLKRFLRLPDTHPEIISALNNQDWRIPLIYVIDRIESRIRFLGHLVVFFPIRTAKIPVVEEHFLSSSEHTLCIENTIVSNKGLESIVVISG